MSRKIILDDIFNNDGAISDLRDGYKERPSQIEAAHRIKDCLDNNKIGVIEGETGMGKSYAYLFPVLLDIIESGFTHRAVIATSGISLQEQLNTKDVPFAIEVMKSLYPNITDELQYTLLKGRQNFICNEKVADLGLYETTKNMIDSSFEKIYDFVNNTKTGDLSELNFIPEQDILEKICCTKKGECTGKNCKYQQECFYGKHKIKLNSSKIIITNYHMLFADNKIGGKILPVYDILVFDEAHEAANIFRDFDALKLSYNTVSMLRNKSSELNHICANYKDSLDPEMFNSVLKEFEIAFFDIEGKFTDLSSPTIINNKDELPKSFYELKTPMTNIDNCIADALSNCEQNLAAFGDSYDDEESKEVTKVYQILQTMSDSSSDILYFITSIENILKDDNKVIWLEKINETVSLNCKKVEVGGSLAEAFFASETVTSIFTSATMSVGGSFEYIKEQLGLNLSKKDVVEFIGSSPFNLEEQQLWYLPEGAIEGNKFGFDKTIAGNIHSIVKATGGGALCLFTSVKNMRNTFYELQYQLPYTIYVQGDMPRTKLVEKFKEDKNSVLFGTRSFFTGVDVPGDALRCVIIDKFPFPQPTDPIQQKLKDRANSFYKYSIPDMVITLKQAIGRGVRSVTDKCVIVILDGRMSTAKYKGRINSSFGYKKTGTRDLEKVKEYCKDFIEESKPLEYPENGEGDEDMPF